MIILTWIIIFDADYDYFWRELLMSIIIIFDVNYDGIFRYLCICDVYFISEFFRDWYPKEKTYSLNSKKVKRLNVRLSDGVFF